MAGTTARSPRSPDFYVISYDPLYARPYGVAWFDSLGCDFRAGDAFRYVDTYAECVGLMSRHVVRTNPVCLCDDDCPESGTPASAVPPVPVRPAPVVVCERASGVLPVWER